MASEEYITVADIMHVHLNQFPPETLQPYVNEANDHYEDIAFEFGVALTEIKIPISTISKRYLLAYVNVRFAESSIGSNNVEITENDMYKVMLNVYEPVLTKQKKKFTAPIITGNADNNPSARSIQSGRLFRTS